MINKDNPLYNILSHNQGMPLLTIVNNLIVNHCIDKKEFFLFEEKYSFLNLFLKKGFSHITFSQDSSQYLEHILEYLNHFSAPEFNLENHINQNLEEFLSFIKNTDDKFCYQILQKINLFNIKDKERLLQYFFSYNKSLCCSHVIEKYSNIDLNKIFIYEIKEDKAGTQEVIIVTKKPIADVFKIETLNDLKINYQSYLSKISFFTPTTVSVYKKGDFISTSHLVSSSDSGRANSENNQCAYSQTHVEIVERQCTPISVEYKTLINKIISHLHDRYKPLSTARRRTRDDQKKMKEIQKQSAELFKYLDSNRINYVNENAQINYSYNLLLIQLSTYFKETLNAILTNPRIDSIDLSIKNNNKINLTSALLRQSNFKQLEKIMKRKKLKHEDLIFSNTVHPSAAIIKTILARDFKSVKKPELQAMQKFLNTLISQTNWSSCDKFGNNIAAQFLLLNAHTTINLVNKEQTLEIKIDNKKNNYYSSSYHHLEKFLTLYHQHKVDMKQKNLMGNSPQDLLLDYSIKNDETSSSAFNLFFNGNKEIGVRGYKNYSDIEKREFLINFCYRIPFFFENRDTREYETNRKIQTMIDHLIELGLLRDQQLTEQVIEKVCEKEEVVKFFSNLSKNNFNNTSAITDMCIAFDRFNLQRQLNLSNSKESGTTVAKRSKI